MSTKEELDALPMYKLVEKANSVGVWLTGETPKEQIIARILESEAQGNGQ
jgi:hypothetical protein